MRALRDVIVGYAHLEEEWMKTNLEVFDEYPCEGGPV